MTPAHLKALVFDIDGTLYRQPPLRRAMLLRVLAMMAVHPLRGWRTVRVLREYRRAQETLRLASETDIAAAQIRLTCERTQVDRRSVVDCVRRWMDEEPLTLLPRFVQPGLLEFLQTCKARGLGLAALSDYPARAKLEALGVADLFDVVLAAQDPDIDTFKPNPRGLLVALEQLGSTPSETLYVGDRIDVDVPTAQAAGVGCAIISRRHTARDPAGPLYVASYAELHDLLWPDRRHSG